MSKPMVEYTSKLAVSRRSVLCSPSQVLSRIDLQDLPRNMAGGFAHKECDHACHISGLSEPLDGALFQDKVFDQLGCIFLRWCFDIPGRDDINVDIVRTEFCGSSLR